MRLKDHKVLCKKAFGLEFREVNEWLDGSGFEKIRHSQQGIKFCKENWGIIGEMVAKFHFICDSINDIPKGTEIQDMDYYKSNKKIYDISHIKETYKNEEIVRDYVKERFQTPLGKAQHKSQVNFINKSIKNFNVKNVLEIACGCARLSKDIVGFKRAVGIDNSDKMLKLAKEIDRRWEFKEGDIFNLNIKEKFDLVFSGRFVKHFKLEERRRIYAQVHKVLNPNGLFIMDINNYKLAYPLRMKHPDNYNIYDELWTKDSLIYELEKEGFKNVTFYGILNQYNLQRRTSWLKYIGFGKIAEKVIMGLEKLKSNEPFEWMVLATKK